MADSRSLLDTAYDAGFSGPGRLHDLFVTFEAMTPGEYKKMDAGANDIPITPVRYLIPCHQVIAKSGKIHRYRWEMARKKAIIGWEAPRDQAISG